MKRVLIGLIVIVAALLLAAPWWLGTRAQTLFTQFIADTDAGLRSVSIIPQSYERGWWTSEAAFEVEAGDAVYDLQAHVGHGPFPLTPWNDSLDFNPALTFIHTELTPIKTPKRLAFSVDYVLDLKGAQIIDAQFAPLTYTYDGLAIEWNAARLHYRLARDLENRRGRLSAQGLALRRGSVSAVFDRLAARASVEEGRLDGGATFQLNTISLARQRFGHGAGKLRWSRIDADSLSRVLQYVAGLVAQGLGPRHMAGALAGILIVEAPELFQYQPRLALETFRIETDDSAITAQGFIAVNTDDPTVLKNPYLLSRAVEASFQARIPEEAAIALAQAWRRLTGQVHGLSIGNNYSALVSAKNLLKRQVAAGHLVLRDGVYSIEIRYTGGVLALNGRPVTNL